MQVGNDSRAVSRLGGEYLQYVQLVLRVEVIRRLVEEINCRTLCQDLCDRDTPPLAAGERRDIPLRKTLEVHELQGSRRNFAILRRFQFERSDVRMTPDQHRLHHGRGKHIVHVLGQKRHSPCYLLPSQRLERLPAQLYVTAIRCKKTRERVHAASLSGAILAEHRDELAARAAIVFQDAFLFDDTIRENITLGLDVPDAEVDAALREAGVRSGGSALSPHRGVVEIHLGGITPEAEAVLERGRLELGPDAPQDEGIAAELRATALGAARYAARPRSLFETPARCFARRARNR